MTSIEGRLRNFVVSMLQEHYGYDQALWWAKVPQSVRLSVARFREYDNRAKGDEEQYLGLRDIRKIILSHWQELFQSVFDFNVRGNKDKRTEWISELGSIKDKLDNKTTMQLHIDEYAKVVDINLWLSEKGI